MVEHDGNGVDTEPMRVGIKQEYKILATQFVSINGGNTTIMHRPTIDTEIFSEKLR
jgi:hypothetical protein